MTKRLNLRSIFMVLVALIVAAGFTSCSKDVLRPNEISPEHLVSGRMDGTWGTPTAIVTPENVPAEVFGAMRLVFTTEGTGAPLKFIAQDCPIVFGNAGATAWAVTGTEDNCKVKLTGAGPVDEFDVTVSSNTMTISFYMGWENTDTKATGKGNFKVTLNRK